MAHEPLRVTLDDLHNAESKGKWWLVGAAWGGDPLVDRQKNAAPLASGVTKEDKLYKLAKKQGMNTEIRQNIFIVLMSSGVLRFYWSPHFFGLLIGRNRTTLTRMRS